MFVRASKLKEAHEIISRVQYERDGLARQLKRTQEGWERANRGWQIAYDTLAESEDKFEQLNAYASQLEIKLAYALNNNGGQGVTFTQDEIKTLISLCHPDKHRNSDRATVMTQRLLELRK